MLKEVEQEVRTLLEELESFNETPNKSKSKRIRLYLGELKKKVTPIRKELIELDKVGY